MFSAKVKIGPTNQFSNGSLFFTALLIFNCLGNSSTDIAFFMLSIVVLQFPLINCSRMYIKPVFKVLCYIIREFSIFIQFINSNSNANTTSRLKNCVTHYTVVKLSLVANNGCSLAFKASGFWQSSRPVDYLNRFALP